MAKTPKRPKSTELYSKQETSTTRIMTEDTMQATWKDITERLQRMERKEVQHATEMKDLKDMYQTERNKINARQAAATGQWARSRQPGTGQERDARDERSNC